MTTTAGTWHGVAHCSSLVVTGWMGLGWAWRMSLVSVSVEYNTFTLVPSYLGHPSVIS